MKTTLYLAAASTLCAAAIAASQHVPAAPSESVIAPTSAPVIALSAELGHSSMLAGGQREIFMAVNFQASAAPAPAVRAPLNLALVIDRSGSMASQGKLEFAKSAADQLVARLGPKDRLSITTYDNQPKVEVASQSGSNKQAFLEAIATITTGGSTNLFAGLVCGAEQVAAAHSPEATQRVILLSDGLPTAGIVDRLEISTRAAAFQERGICVSTLGMGLDYDEDLMQQIAQRSGGNYYYVAQAEQVGAYLDQELRKLAQITARASVLHISLAPGIQVTDVFGYSFSQSGTTLTVPIPDLRAGHQRKLIMRMLASGQPGQTQAIADIALDYIDAGSLAAVHLTAPPMRVHYTNDPQQVVESRNFAVLNQVEVTKNGKAMVDAMQLQKQGEFDAALQLLRARHLSGQLYRSSQLDHSPVQQSVDAIKRMMDEIERTRHDVNASRDLTLHGGLSGLGYMASE